MNFLKKEKRDLSYKYRNKIFVSFNLKETPNIKCENLLLSH